ncbi:helix-turn-helix domain-containing protein [Deinococcus ruber]|uniref:Transcriptional regulator n=1 Tax=Deinococcus ruber TaxID=1848197 RepID=A0A918KXG2_9DEIO|nr:XRE family transcriptional regulator [Deinococcus ruber]GGR39821.1 transcriptional regulator [Deinococcus ruber]
MSEDPLVFVGARLRQAREAFGLSVESLGDMLGVTRQAVDQFERGKHPSSEHFIKLCLVLNKPGSYFYRPILADYSNETIFFRKLKKAPITEIKSARSTTEWIGEIANLLDSEVDFPNLNLPVLPQPDSNPLLITEEYIELAANEVRRTWGLGDLPIGDLVGTMESNGIIVVRMNFHSHDIDGLSVWDKKIDRPFIILNADKASAVRSRFDAAHELGHLLLHRNISKDDLKAFDTSIEKQAHFFASCLLLPTQAFRKQIFTASMLELKSLKQYWKVSIAAMIMRLESLGVFDKSRSRLAWSNYIRRGWKVEEPFDDVWIPESPALFKQAIELLVEEKVYSNSQILELLFPEEVFLGKVSNLEPEFFRPSANLKLRAGHTNLKMG